MRSITFWCALLCNNQFSEKVLALFFTKKIVTIVSLSFSCCYTFFGVSNLMSVDAKFSASLFEGKTILVTGGTGSFGGYFVDYLLDKNFKEIRVLSRDELK